MRRRIVKRGDEFVIQEPHWLFRIIYVDMWINKGDANYKDTFKTYQEALDFLFKMKTKNLDIVVYVD